MLKLVLIAVICFLNFSANKKHQPYVPDKSDIQKSSATSTAVTPAGNMNIRPHLQLNYNSIQNYIGYEETKSKPLQPMVKINSPPNDKWSYKISDELHETGAAKGFIQKPSYQPKYQQIISRYRPVKPAASIRNEKFDYASPELMLSKFSHPQVSAFTSANNVPLRNSGTQQFQQSIASYKQTLPLSRPSEYQPQDIYSALRSSVSQQPDDLFSNNPPAAKLSSVQEQSNDMQYYLQQRPKVHDSLGQNWMTYVEQRLAELTSRNDILPKMTHHVQKPVFSNSQSQPSLISKNVVNNLVKINQQNIKTALPNKQNTFLDFFDNSKQYLGNHANINLKHFMPNNQNTIKTPTGNNMISRDQFVHQKPNVQAFSSARFNEMNNDRFQTHGAINMNHGSMAVGKPITRNMNPYSNQNQILSEIINNKYQTMQSQRNAYKAQTAIQEEPKDTFSDFPYVTANAKHNFVSVPLSSSPELSLQVEYQTPQPPETANAISRSRLPQSTPMKPRQIQGNVLYSLAQYTSIPNAVIAKKVKTAPNSNKNIRKPYANQNLPNYRNSLTARVKGTPIQQEYQQNYIKAAPPQRAMLFSRKLPQIARPYQPNQQQQNGYFQRNSLRPMVLSRSPSAIRVPKVSTDKTQFRYRSPVASQSKSPAVSFSKVLEAYYLNSFPQRQPQLTNKALMNSRSNGYYMHNFRNSQSARLRGVATPAKKVNPGALNNAEKQVSVLQNPWVQYQRAKAGLQSRAQFSPKLAILQLNQRDHQYQAADSHAQTSTNSDTTAGATAPGQKGAGYNFGYGYGYGSGNENQGGGWGKGWGGGGPGVNSAGAHQPPNYQNNPSFKYGFGQGMGQGGKGVTQQNQGNPGPSRSKVYNQNLASSFISPRKPSLGTVVPRGPSIMNFGSTNKWKSSMLDLSSLRPSSPAYQIKYFTTNMANGAQTSSDRILKNEIISNAIADALKGLQKKKRRKRKNDKEIT